MQTATASPAEDTTAAVGTVTDWGLGGMGQKSIPEDLTGVTAISAGQYDSLALKSDGTVVAWGSQSELLTKVPADLTDVIAISAGRSHSMVVQSDGTVVAWGSSEYGKSTVPDGLLPVTAVAAGGAHSLALQNDGTVVAWGWSEYGQASVPADLTGVTAISAGGNHSVALKSDGTVVAWGADHAGQASVPADLTGVTAIAAGDKHVLALKSDGTVVAWGQSAYVEDDVSPSAVPSDLPPVSAIAAGGNTSMALTTDGAVITWGDDRRAVPEDLGVVLAISQGYSHSLALVASEPVFTADAPASSAVAGLAYSYQFAADDASTFTATGMLPNGLTLSTAGLLTGMPTTAGSFTFTVTAINGPVSTEGASHTVEITAAATELGLNLNMAVGDLAAGAEVELSGKGLQADSAYEVVVRSTPTTIAFGSVASDGTFTNTGVLPAGLEAGQHTVTLSGIAADGTAASRVAYFTINSDGMLTYISYTAAETLVDTATLASTGFDAAPLGAAALLLLAGTALMVQRRRSVA
jgi:hypothetical protein